MLKFCACIFIHQAGYVTLGPSSKQAARCSSANVSFEWPSSLLSLISTPSYQGLSTPSLQVSNGFRPKFLEHGIHILHLLSSSNRASCLPH